MKNLLSLLMLLVFVPVVAQDIDVQGHRGARGMMPENTIPAFIYALQQGVTTLEMDVVVTQDNQLVVSHEPWISPEICLNSDSTALLLDNDKVLNIYHMTYEEVKAYDCGSLFNPRFPEQQKVKVSKPLLSEVIKSVEWYIKSYTQYEVDYNIEIKTTPEGDEVFHPIPETYSDLLYQTIDQYLPMERIIIQSFDFRVLRYWHEHYPTVRLAALVENKRSVDTNLANLGFKPDIYSPYYELLSVRKIADLQAKGIKVIPWTVNDEKEMKKLVRWGVDGLITDYPAYSRALGLNHPLEEAQIED